MKHKPSLALLLISLSFLSIIFAATTLKGHPRLFVDNYDTIRAKIKKAPYSNFAKVISGTHVKSEETVGESVIPNAISYAVLGSNSCKEAQAGITDVLLATDCDFVTGRGLTRGARQRCVLNF
jgi:hypothetical protein